MQIGVTDLSVWYSGTGTRRIILLYEAAARAADRGCTWPIWFRALVFRPHLSQLVALLPLAGLCMVFADDALLNVKGRLTAYILDLTLFLPVV